MMVAGTPFPLGRRPVHVFAATCAGSDALGRQVGLPLVHVEASTDVDASIARLNARRHGAGLMTAHPFEPLDFEDGWADWSLLPYEPACPSPGWDGGGEGVRPSGGCLHVSLPRDASPFEFRLQLRAGLRHLRLQEVTATPAYMAPRFEEVLQHLVPLRYTGNGRNGFLRGAAVVDDLYVLDPARPPLALFWTVVAVRAAAVLGSLQ